MTGHQPANWIAGESAEVVTIMPDRNVVNLLWWQGEWLTEGELEVMVHNQLQAGMILDAESSAWMLNAVSVYDEWWDEVTSSL